MARSVTSFEIGNSANLKLTDELAELFLNTLKATGRISVSAGRCCVGAKTVRTWLRKGREENAQEPFKSFADRVEKTRAEFLAVAAQRMGQLAIGGVLNLPKYDKLNQLVRDAEGEIEFEERYFPPNVNALAHVLDRIDPMPNLEPEQPGIAAPAELDPERVRAETLFYYGLAKQSVGILVDLGVDRKTIEMAAIIDRFETQITVETSSTKVEPEPATPSPVATASDPPKPDPEPF